MGSAPRRITLSRIASSEPKMMQCTSPEEECVGDLGLVGQCFSLRSCRHSGWFSGTMQTAQHFILNQLEETSLRATTWSSKIVRWEEISEPRSLYIFFTCCIAPFQVVYARRMLPRAGSGGGRVFNMRGHGGGQGGTRLTFRLVLYCF